jgi:glucose-1-phosphate thymidylyltransferase
MKALVLAAGYATRLYPLTKDFPKPLLKVGNRPIIDYIVDKLEEIEEVGDIIVVTNSRFVRHFRRWAKARRSFKPISVLDDLTKSDSTKRGAIGDMHFSINKKRIKDDLLVVGGDNLFDGSLGGFLDFSRARKMCPVIGLHRLKDRSQASKYGVVRLDRRGRVLDFQEKPPRPKSSLVAMCLYYFPRSRLGLIKRYMKSRSVKKDATGFYIDWLRRKQSVYGFIFEGRWFDIGHHSFYRQAKSTFVK